MKKKIVMWLLAFLTTAGSALGQTVDKPAVSNTCKWYVAHEKLTIEPTDGSVGELANWTDTAPWSEYAESIREVDIPSPYTVYAKTVRSMFAGMKNLRSIDLSGLNVRNLEDKESITLASSDKGYMFYGAQCPSVITLPTPNALRCEEYGIPLPNFKGIADYIQKVGDGDIFNPDGAKYNDYEEMQQAWLEDKSETLWKGTYVLMKNASSMPTSYTLNASTGLGTLCYPVAVNLLSKGEWKVKAYRITGFSRENGTPTLELTQWNEGTLTANIPVMLYKEGGSTLTLPSLNSAFSLAPRIINDEGNLLRGCYGTPTIFGDPDGYAAESSRQYVYQTSKDGKTSFYRVNPDKPIHAVSFRCYLELPSESVAEQQNAAKFYFAIPSDEVSSISDVLTADDVDNRQGIYDLQGKRAKQMNPGNVYIVNGVKLVVR